MKKQVGKKHHFVPRFYLSSFCDNSAGNDRIFCFDKWEKKSFQQYIMQEAMERLFYGYEEWVEKYLSNVEGKVSSIIKTINDKESIDFLLYTKEQQILSYWIYLQDHRTRLYREQMKNSINKASIVMKQKWGIEEITINENKARSLQIDQFNPYDPDVRKAIDGLANQKWHLYTNKNSDNSFYTSDHPIIRENLLGYILHKQGEKIPPLKYTLGYLSRGIEIRYPLSPALCLVIHDKATTQECIKLGYDGLRGSKINSDENDVAWTNSILIGQSYRYLFSKKTDFSFALDFLNEHPEHQKPYLENTQII